MKALPLLVVAGVCGLFFTNVASQARPPHAVPAAKECTDCGCCGADKGGGCTMEKGKTCHCKK